MKHSLTISRLRMHWRARAIRPPQMRAIIGAVAIVLSATACADSTVVSPVASTPSRANDLNETPTGNVNWLAPLGTTPANPATFDAAAVTRVEVCPWTSNACSGLPVAAFAIAPAGAEGALLVNATDGKYEASWSLLSTKFITRKTYRIRALHGSTEVGAILVDVVRGRWALTRTDGSLAPLTAASTLDIAFHVTAPVPPMVRVNEVESSGGTPGDWAEFTNTGSTTVDLSGFVFKDNDDTHAYTLPAGTMIAPGAYLVLDEATFGFGLGSNDAVRLFMPSGTLVDTYAWTSHAATTYGRCPNGTGAFATMTTTTKGNANDCTVPNTIMINEVESSGGTPGDWAELMNTGASTVNVSGYVFKDNDDTHAYTLPAGTTIAPGAYLVVDEATFGFGLGSGDAARLYNASGALVDSYTWTAHATTTYGRCPNGTGAFVTTVAPTKGAANSCVASGPVTEIWPGSDDVTTVDGTSVFGGNLSGLIFEPATQNSPDVLWGARNGPGSIFRLVYNGSIWTPDASDNWSAGKLLRYMDGNGEPDTEDLTFTTGSSAGMYIVSERNNSASSVSRPSILRYDVTAAGATLTASNEWVLTADLPVVAANSGLEAITWIPDDYLVARGFYDATAGHLYNPAEYANHGGGLFFVGLEANGMVYVYALNHATNTFTRIASFSTGFPAGVMALQFDRELGQLWAVCDDTCGGLSNIYVIDVTPASPTLGMMTRTHTFARPGTMPNINNEGFAFAPQSSCVANKKAAFWSDDSETGGHSIRKASIPCVVFP